MIYNLGKYPHIQDKIYQEVESVVGKDGDVTTKHLAKVSYLKAFTRESMRCAPYCLYLTPEWKLGFFLFFTAMKGSYC